MCINHDCQFFSAALCLSRRPMVTGVDQVYAGLVAVFFMLGFTAALGHVSQLQRLD